MLTSAAGADGGLSDSIAEIIHRERHWFEIPDGGAVVLPRSRVMVSRWIEHAAERCEHEAEIGADCHVVGIALQPMLEIIYYAARKLIHTGHLARGSMYVNEPRMPARVIFRGAHDVIHLHVPNAMISEYADSERVRSRTTPLVADHPIVDPVIERLARELIHAEELGGAFGQSYADGISLAIIAQLLGGGADGATTGRRRVTGLSKWRLKRATEYMAANLSEPISHTDIATAAGLSRMHFAAQFRVATGLRPHEYLLQQRIERAQALMLTTRMPLAQIALEVGFKTQAHFTTVFARLVGETPRLWRQCNDRGSRIATLKAA
jgi:AraC family transcriptional regulator